SGKIREIVHLPGNSWLPFLAAVVLAFLCISLLIKLYWLAIAAAVAALGLLFRWSWENGAWENGEWKHGEVPAPDQPPLHSRTTDGPGVWGMATTLLANGSLYFSLLFGWLFLWTVAPQWQV